MNNKDLKIYEEVRTQMFAGAGTSISMRSCLWLLDALKEGYGDGFSLDGAIDALEMQQMWSRTIIKELHKARARQ